MNSTISQQHPIGRTGRTKALFRIIGYAICAFFVSCAITCGKGTPTSKNDVTPPVNLPPLEEAAACISGDRAMKHIETIISFGPRHVGTKGSEQTRKYIRDTLTSFGIRPNVHSFTAHTPKADLKTVKMENITADINPKGPHTILISGHFDGKIIDGGGFQGANDGGSSTGLLLEMARCLHQHPTEVPVKIVFFDGEEALVKWSDSDSLYGSKNLAATFQSTGESKSIGAMINIDMIGDKRLRLFRDLQSTPWIMDTLGETAETLGLGTLFTGPATNVGDDHLPFLHLGIPAAVLIDLQFGPGWDSNAYWHTPKDSMDKISAQSMEQVGKIVILSLKKLHNRSKNP